MTERFHEGLGSAVRVNAETLQLIPLRLIEPSEWNCRLFVAREALDELRKAYASYHAGISDHLPDPLTVRFRGPHFPFELLSGHRRVMAAAEVGVDALYCRVYEMTDEEAYVFIRQANRWEEITTVELARAAYELAQRGHTQKEVVATLALPNASRGGWINRYMRVGELVDPKAFTDAPKRCDPSITIWDEATRFGPDHFAACFAAWDAGLWDLDECERRFRRRGVALPLDNTQKGLRITISRDGRSLDIRGKLPLDLLSDSELREITNQATMDLQHLVRGAIHDRAQGFGRRQVRRYNPETLT